MTPLLLLTPEPLVLRVLNDGGLEIRPFIGVPVILGEDSGVLAGLASGESIT